MLGGMFRFWQGYTISYYAISFFAPYLEPVQYGVWNAICVACGGFSSNMIGGYISDKFEKQNYRTKSWVASIMSINAVFISLILFLLPGSFSFSIAMLFMDYLLCEGWLSPVYAMI